MPLAAGGLSSSPGWPSTSTGGPSGASLATGCRSTSRQGPDRKAGTRRSRTFLLIKIELSSQIVWLKKPLKCFKLFFSKMFATASHCTPHGYLLDMSKIEAVPFVLRRSRLQRQKKCLTDSNPLLNYTVVQTPENKFYCADPSSICDRGKNWHNQGTSSLKNTFRG
jgi:hypothetical protein